MMNNKIHLTQEKYVNSILEKFLGPNEKGSKYPMKDGEFGEDKDMQKQPINSFIGSLRFLVDRTRPDLLYPLAILSRYIKNPNDYVMQECNRLLRYILFTKSYHITLGGDNELELYGMSDASYVQSGDCRSMLGYSIFLGKSAPVYSRCMKSTTVSLSSTQTEVEALVELTKEIIWFRGFLDSIGIKIDKPTKILTDNMPAVLLAADGNHLKRSKHFVVRTAYLKEQVENGIIEVEHIPGLQNPTDILTKPLAGHLLKSHTSRLLGMK